MGTEAKTAHAKIEWLKARQTTYGLLARLYLAEPSPEVVDDLRQVPDFAESLPDDAHLAEWLEEEAAEYHWLFGMNAYPYESLYADADLMLNTEASEQVSRLYSRCGFDPIGFKTGAPDHLGVEFALMSELIAAEARALRSGDVQRVGWARDMQLSLLTDHLATWAPVYSDTVLRIARRPLHRSLARRTTEVLLTDLQDPGAEVRAHSAEGATTPGFAEGAMPTSPHPRFSSGQALDGGGEQGINAVVRKLITPVEVGVFITRADISALARGLELTVPIGDRFQMMRGLFAGAGQFGLVLRLLDGLADLVERGRLSVAQRVSAYPCWGAYAEAWETRLNDAHDIVAGLRSDASV